jgi:hypothetical protein
VAPVWIPRIFFAPVAMTRTWSAVSSPWARTISSMVCRGLPPAWLLNSAITSAASSCVRKPFFEATAMKVISKFGMKGTKILCPATSGSQRMMVNHNLAAPSGI